MTADPIVCLQLPSLSSPSRWLAIARSLQIYIYILTEGMLAVKSGTSFVGIYRWQEGTVIVARPSCTCPTHPIFASASTSILFHMMASSQCKYLGIAFVSQCAYSLTVRTWRHSERGTIVWPCCLCLCSSGIQYTKSSHKST